MALQAAKKNVVKPNKAPPRKKAAPKVKGITYLWEGIDRKGQKVKGEAIAPSVAIVRAQLRRQGVIAKKVKKKPSDLFAPRKKPIAPADIAIITRQLATMMKAGVPLVQSFDIIGRGHEKPSVQDLILNVKADVESGTSFAEAIRKHPRYFDDLFCDLVAAGEQSGALEGMLDRIATYKEKTEALKSKIKKALFYPAAVVAVALIVTTILLVFVVPMFEDMFTSFGADLPAFTKFVITLSEFMQANWWMFAIGIVVAVMAHKNANLNSQAYRDALDRFVLKLPIISEILNKAAIARYARTLSTTFAAGVPLVEALESAAGASGNVVYKTAILKIRDDVSTGMQMNLSMNSTGIFPNMVVQMVAIGEESGALDSMLGKIADIYEAEVDDMVDGLSSLLEPLIMVVLGVLVGGLIVAMYLPIFQLGAVV